jgi:hypothetical protein
MLDQLPAEARSSHYFDETFDTLLGHTTRIMETWLAHTEPLVQHGLAEAAQTVATGHLNIRDYFFPIDASTPPD